MLEKIHPNPVAKTNSKTRRQNRRPETEGTEDQRQNQQKEEPGSPCPIIGNEGKNRVPKGGCPFPIDKDLELLVHPMILKEKNGNEDLKRVFYPCRVIGCQPKAPLPPRPSANSLERR
jgi:hypothetical protein